MRSRRFGFVIAALALAVSVWAYPRLPETVATHWNLHGEPDGYSSRFWAVAFMPLLILGLTGLFMVLPRVDPRRENYDKVFAEVAKDLPWYPYAVYNAGFLVPDHVHGVKIFGEYILRSDEIWIQK